MSDLHEVLSADETSRLANIELELRRLYYDTYNERLKEILGHMLDALDHDRLWDQ